MITTPKKTSEQNATTSGKRKISANVSSSVQFSGSVHNGNNEGNTQSTIDELSCGTENQVKKQEINIKNFARKTTPLNKSETYLRELFHSSKKRCVICKKTFQTDDKLSAHFQKCDLLNPIINAQLNPDVYIYRNDGLDDIDCEFPHCKYITPYKQNYNKHIIQEHTKSFLFRCYVCDRGFVDKYDKITHNCQKRKRSDETGSSSVGEKNVELSNKTTEKDQDIKSDVTIDSSDEECNTKTQKSMSNITKSSTPQLLLERVTSSQNKDDVMEEQTQSATSETEHKQTSRRKRRPKSSAITVGPIDQISMDDKHSVSDNEITKSHSKEKRKYSKLHRTDLKNNSLPNKSLSDTEDGSPKAKVKKFNKDSVIELPKKLSSKEKKKNNSKSAESGNDKNTVKVNDSEKEKNDDIEILLVNTKNVKKGRATRLTAKTEPISDDAGSTSFPKNADNTESESKTDTDSHIELSAPETNDNVQKTSTPIIQKSAKKHPTIDEQMIRQFTVKVNYEQLNKNLKSLSCFYPECGYKTRYQVNFLRHCVAKHKLPQPFHCSECGQGFQSTTTKIRHIKLVHNSKLESKNESNNTISEPVANENLPAANPQTIQVALNPGSKNPDQEPSLVESTPKPSDTHSPPEPTPKDASTNSASNDVQKKSTGATTPLDLPTNEVPEKHQANEAPMEPQEGNMDNATAIKGSEDAIAPRTISSVDSPHPINNKTTEPSSHVSPPTADKPVAANILKHQSTPESVILPTRRNGLYSCDICTYAVCSGTRYRTHRWRHSIDAKYSCDRCGIRYNKTAKLIRHKWRCKSVLLSKTNARQTNDSSTMMVNGNTQKLKKVIEDDFDILALSWDNDLDIEYLILHAPDTILISKENGGITSNGVNDSVPKGSPSLLNGNHTPTEIS